MAKGDRFAGSISWLTRFLLFVRLSLPRSPLFVAAPFAIIARWAHASVYLSVEQAQQAIFPGATYVAENLTLTDEQARAIAQRSGVRVRVLEQGIWRVPGAGWFIVDE